MKTAQAWRAGHERMAAAATTRTVGIDLDAGGSNSDPAWMPHPMGSTAAQVGRAIVQGTDGVETLPSPCFGRSFAVSGAQLFDRRLPDWKARPTGACGLEQLSR